MKFKDMLDKVPKLTDKQFDDLMAAILRHHEDKFRRCVAIYSGAMAEVVNLGAEVKRMERQWRGR